MTFLKGGRDRYIWGLINEHDLALLLAIQGSVWAKKILVDILA